MGSPPPQQHPQQSPLQRQASRPMNSQQIPRITSPLPSQRSQSPPVASAEEGFRTPGVLAQTSDQSDVERLSSPPPSAVDKGKGRALDYFQPVRASIDRVAASRFNIEDVLVVPSRPRTPQSHPLGESSSSIRVTVNPKPSEPSSTTHFTATHLPPDVVPPQTNTMASGTGRANPAVIFDAEIERQWLGTLQGVHPASLAAWVDEVCESHWRSDLSALCEALHPLLRAKALELEYHARQVLHAAFL